MKIQEDGLIIQKNVICHKCGIQTECISEDDGDNWECRECYSGLSKQEQKERLKQVFKALR